MRIRGNYGSGKRIALSAWLRLSLAILAQHCTVTESQAIVGVGSLRDIDVRLWHERPDEATGLSARAIRPDEDGDPGVRRAISGNVWLRQPAGVGSIELLIVQLGASFDHGSDQTLRRGGRTLSRPE